MLSTIALIPFGLIGDGSKHASMIDFEEGALKQSLSVPRLSKTLSSSLSISGSPVPFLRVLMVPVEQSGGNERNGGPRTRDMG